MAALASLWLLLNCGVQHGSSIGGPPLFCAYQASDREGASKLVCFEGSTGSPLGDPLESLAAPESQGKSVALLRIHPPWPRPIRFTLAADARQPKVQRCSMSLCMVLDLSPQGFLGFGPKPPMPWQAQPPMVVPFLITDSAGCSHQELPAGRGSGFRVYPKPQKNWFSDERCRAENSRYCNRRMDHGSRAISARSLHAVMKGPEACFLRLPQGVGCTA